MKKIIHVNQHFIRANKKNLKNNAVLSVKFSGKNLYGHECDIEGPSKLVYRPDKPLSCGARVWIETMSTVLLDGKNVEEIESELGTVE